MQQPFTAEQIQFLDQRYGHKSRDSDAVKQFRSELSQWSKASANENVKATTLINGVYAAIRLKLNLKNMNALSDDMLPQAKQAFEEFRERLW